MCAFEAAQNAPKGYAPKRPDIRSLSEAFQRNTFEYALLLAKKFVNGIVCTQVGKTSRQTIPFTNVLVKSLQRDGQRWRP